MITIAECSSDEQALVLKALLADCGVSAHLPDERAVSYPPLLGSLRVQVSEEDEESARRILDSQVQ